MENFILNKDEMCTFFAKYSPIQLEQFKGMLQFVTNYNKKIITEALEETIMNKQIQCVFPEEYYDYSDTYKINELSDLELDFFKTILDDVDDCLNNIEKEDYECEIHEVYSLLNLIELEKKGRENANTKIIIKLKKA